MTRRVTLLLADESPIIRRLVELTFAGEPISMIAVGGGGAALDEIAARPPDIVIADARLPKPDGYDLSSFLKRTPALAHIPVILLTPAFEPVDQARAAAVGCDAVLSKPVDPPELEWKVKHLLRDPAPVSLADLSLADRLDAIDADLLQPAGQRADGTNPADRASLVSLHDGLVSLDDCSLSLADCFDRVDEECRRRRHDGLKRAFAALLDAATPRRAGGRR